MVTRLSLAMLFLSVFCSPYTFAKAPTAAISITGPRLTQPLHLADEPIIAANVWVGNFADWDSGAVAVPDTAGRPYRVHFWVQFTKDDIELKYVLDYRWLDEEDRAIICLPGRDSVWFQTNVYTILRRGQDGKCFYADADWGRAVHAALAKPQLTE